MQPEIDHMKQLNWAYEVPGIYIHIAQFTHA